MNPSTRSGPSSSMIWTDGASRSTESGSSKFGNCRQFLSNSPSAPFSRRHASCDTPVMAFWNRWRGALILPGILALTIAASALPGYDDFSPPPIDRDNLRWREAIRRFSGRYEGLTAAQADRVRGQERRYAALLDALTAMDGMGS